MPKSNGESKGNSLDVTTFEPKGKRGRKKSDVRNWAEEVIPMIISEELPRNSFVAIPSEKISGMNPTNVRANIASAIKALGFEKDLRAGESKNGKVGIVVR